MYLEKPYALDKDFLTSTHQNIIQLFKKLNYIDFIKIQNSCPAKDIVKW